MEVSQNIINATNIGVLLALFGSLTYVISKKKYESAISIGMIIAFYIIFKYILKIF